MSLVQDDHCFLGRVDQVVDVVCALEAPMHCDVAVAVLVGKRCHKPGVIGDELARPC